MLRALIFALLIPCLVSPAVADNKAQTQQQLDAARADIAELKKLLEKIQQEKSGVQQQLKRTESEMGQLQRQVRDLEGELKGGEQELKRLDDEKKKLQQSRLEQQELIAIQARAAYQSGQQEPLRLILNQQQPEHFSRNLTYYDYLGQARVEQINAFNETLRQLANIETDIARQQELLAEQKVELEERRQALAEVRQQRQAALAKLNSEYGAGDRKLKAREADQRELANVLKTIEETLARQAREAEQTRLLAAERAAAAQSNRRDLPLGPQVSSGSGVSGPFSSARGKLPWPVSGNILARFGSPRDGDARAKWDGVLIGASAGTQVRAIHSGRVVFADWLRGAGLLVIVDHGNGYLSLYGHNQSLLKEAGQQVRAGDAIATVGSSGGHDRPALYFAIRQQGRPSDPAQWCSTQG